MKNGKKLYNERGITFFHETERYLNNLNIYNRSKNGTNLWDDLILNLYVQGKSYSEISKIINRSRFVMRSVIKWFLENEI